MNRMIVVLIALCGCTDGNDAARTAPTEGSAGSAEVAWEQLHVWESATEGGIITDVEVPSGNWRLLVSNTGDDFVMVGVADAQGRDVALVTATEKAVDTVQVRNSKGVHKLAVSKIGQAGKYKVVLEYAVPK